MGNPFSGADLVDRIHKWVQVFLHSYITTCLEDVDTGVLTDFSNLKRHVEGSEWMKSTPVWVEIPTEKYYGGRNSDSGGGGAMIQAQRKSEKGEDRETDPQLKVMEKFEKFYTPLVAKDTCAP